MAMYLGDKAVKIIERSKNLIPFDYADRGKPSGGITYTVNNDGSVTLNGLSTAPSEIVLTYGMDLPKGVYTYKLNLSHYVWNIFGYIACILDGAYVAFPNHITVSGDELTRTFEITQDMIDAGYKIRLNIYVQAAGVQADNLIIKPMLNEGSTPAPYGKKDSNIYFRVRSGVNMGRNPKNLIPFPYVTKSKTENGITFTVQDDGSVKVEGTATANAQFYFKYRDFFEWEAGKPLTISGGTAGCSVNLRRYDVDGNSKWFIESLGNSATGTLLEGETINGCSLYVMAGTTINETIYPMLNEGTKALPYYYYD